MTLSDANPQQLARIEAIADVDVASLVRLLGDWRVGEGPLYERLARRLAQLLSDGRLAVGTRVPAERHLAAQLQVSRNTTTRAYSRLRDNELLVSRQGSGSVTQLGRGNGLPRMPWRAAAPSLRHGELIDLTIASPFPPPGLADVLARTVARSDSWLAGHGYDPLGMPALREVIAARYTDRGLSTRPQQVLVTAGAQHAIDLLCRLHLRRKEVVLVESPTYPGALDALRRSGARLTSFDVAEDGWHPERIVELATQTSASLAYLIPDFQNPTGRLMSDEDRGRLMSGLARLPITVIADETLVDVRLEGEARRPLQAPPGACAVVSVGSLGKSVWAGLRIGWIRASESMIDALATLRTANDLASPAFEQATAVELLSTLDDRLAGPLHQLRGQRDLLVKRLREDLGWEPRTPSGGLSVWVRLPEGSSSALAEAAPRFGLALAAGPRLSPDGALDGFIRIPYTLPPRTLAEAVLRLHAAYRSVRGATGQASTLVI